MESTLRTVTLDQLDPGQQARIVRIDGHDGIACRLREMGFVAGQGVTFFRAAPFGDPLRCSIQGTRVAVRIGEARRVQVEYLLACGEPLSEDVESSSDSHDS